MRKIARLLAAAALSLYLGLHNGHIALLDGTSTQPVHVFPYRAELYPNADRQALEDGVPITSQKELSRLLEDYLS